MTATGDRYEANQTRIEEYWDWIAVALFLLVTVDLLTTMFATAVVGTAGELNPLMAWLVGQPISVVVLVNVAVVVASAVIFRGVIATLRAAPSAIRPYYAFWVELWLGMLIAVGLFVFANNLSVIVLGRSIL